MKGKIQIVEGDITKMDVDAIVNAAHTSLLGGGGVDGAIHRVSGPELLKECKTLNGCPTGQAKITKGYRLAAKWVIHTVGPVWNGGNHHENKLLADCYRNSLNLTTKYDIASIAFPAISTGVYRFPLEQAACIAIEQTIRYCENHTHLVKIVFVCFGSSATQTYQNIFNEIGQKNREA